MDRLGAIPFCQPNQANLTLFMLIGLLFGVLGFSEELRAIGDANRTTNAKKRKTTNLKISRRSVWANKRN